MADATTKQWTDAHPGLEASPFPLTVGYGGMNVEVTATEVPAENAGDPPVLTHTVVSNAKPEPFGEEAKEKIDALVAAVQDLFNHFLENRATLAEVARMEAERVAKLDALNTEDAKTARATVQKKAADEQKAREDAAAAQAKAAETTPATG